MSAAMRSEHSRQANLNIHITATGTYLHARTGCVLHTTQPHTSLYYKHFLRQCERLPKCSITKHRRYKRKILVCVSIQHKHLCQDDSIFCVSVKLHPVSIQYERCHQQEMKICVNTKGKYPSVEKKNSVLIQHDYWQQQKKISVSKQLENIHLNLCASATWWTLEILRHKPLCLCNRKTTICIRKTSPSVQHEQWSTI